MSKTKKAFDLTFDDSKMCTRLQTHQRKMAYRSTQETSSVKCVRMNKQDEPKNNIFSNLYKFQAKRMEEN